MVWRGGLFRGFWIRHQKHLASSIGLGASRFIEQLSNVYHMYKTLETIELAEQCQNYCNIPLQHLPYLQKSEIQRKPILFDHPNPA